MSNNKFLSCFGLAAFLATVSLFGMSCAAANPTYYTTTKLVFSSKQDVTGKWDGISSEPGYRNIWTMLIDGTEMKALTSRAVAANGGAKLPGFSPDGTKIIFRADYPMNIALTTPLNSSINVWMMDSDGSSLTALTQNINSGLDSCYGFYSPDGNRIAFISKTALSGSWNGTAALYNVWIMDADGNNRTPLTQMTTGGVVGTHLEFSSDGTQIIFASNGAIDGTTGGAASLSPNVWKVNVDGTGLTALTKNTNASLGTNLWPSFAGDGKKIVFASAMPMKEDGSFDVWDGTALASENIWIMDANGTNLKALTRNTGSGYGTLLTARFSPDSSKIVFISKTAIDGSWDGTATLCNNVWVMNADGTGLTAITKNTGASYLSDNITFTPDSEKLAFISMTALDGTWDGTATLSYNIWLADTDGTDVTALTRNSIANLDSFINYTGRGEAFFQYLSR